MKSNTKNILALALILFPGVALSSSPKKRNFEVIQPKQVIKVIVKDTETVHRNKRRFVVIQRKQVIKVIIKDNTPIRKRKVPQVFFGPHGKIELPSESSEPENTLFPTISFK